MITSPQKFTTIADCLYLATSMAVYSISSRSWDARTSLRLVPLFLKIESDILYLLGGMMSRLHKLSYTSFRNLCKYNLKPKTNIQVRKGGGILEAIFPSFLVYQIANVEDSFYRGRWNFQEAY